MNTQVTRKELLHTLSMIRDLCDHMEAKVDTIRPEKKWLSTNEFAEKSDITPKTVTNYCSRGDFGEHQKKNSKGRWLIHKSELTE